MFNIQVNILAILLDQTMNTHFLSPVSRTLPDYIGLFLSIFLIYSSVIAVPVKTDIKKPHQQHIQVRCS